MRMPAKLPLAFLRAALLGISLFGLMAAPDSASAAAPLETGPDFGEMVAQARAEMVANPMLAVRRAERLEKIARSGHAGEWEIEGLATAKCIQAEANLRLGNTGKAQNLVEAAIASLPAGALTSHVMGYILLTRGGIFAAKPDIVHALSDYQAAYRIFHKFDDSRSQVISLLYIASLYGDAQDFNNSFKYYTQALDIPVVDPKLSISIYNNRANSLTQAGKFDRAAVDYSAALKIAKSMGSAALQSQIFSNLAGSQLNAGHVDDAERTISLGMRLSRQDETSPVYMQLVSDAARVALERGRVDEATRLIRQVFAGVNLADTPLTFRNSHETAVAVFKRIGEPALALAHLEAMKRLDDETTKLAASTNTALMTARFDYANQNLKIAKLRQTELERTVEFEKTRARTQRVIFSGVVVATVIGVGMLIFGLVTIRRSRNDVRAANVELARTNTALERALAAKTEFLATTSHEIRTPLNGILGMTQVMLADQTLPEAVRERLGVVKSAGTTMRALVDDILDVAKMETGNLTIDAAPMDLHATMHDVSRLWAEQARARGVSFTVDLDDAPKWIECDPARVRQIVFNLLSNALKFTHEGSVTIRASAEAGGILQVAVTDTGIGIPLDKQAEIFESFRQVDAGTTRKYGGTGLGLAICRNLANAMGGDVTVRSAPGEGATFALTLPLILASQPAVAEMGQPVPRGLLIVERNLIAAATFRALFEPRAGEVCIARSVEEAIDIVGRGGIKAVLVDSAMLSAVQATPADTLTALVQAARGVPVHLLSGRLTRQRRARLETCGLAAIIEKPIGGAQLVERLFPQPRETTTGSGIDEVASCVA